MTKVFRVYTRAVDGVPNEDGCSTEWEADFDCETEEDALDTVAAFLPERRTCGCEAYYKEEDLPELRDYSVYRYETHVTTIGIKARSEEEAIAQAAKGLGEEYDTDFCEVQNQSEWSAEADYVPSEEE